MTDRHRATGAGDSGPARPRGARDAALAQDDLELARMVGRGRLADADAAAWRDPVFLARFFDGARARREAEDGADERAMLRDTLRDMLRDGQAAVAHAAALRARIVRPASRISRRRARLAAPIAATLDEALAERMTPEVDLAVAAGPGRELWDEPAEHWIEIPAELPAARYVALRIAGDSMAPLMHTGDTVLVRLDPRVRVGSVVVARHPDDGYVCKRVHRARGATIELASLDRARPLVVIPRDARLVLGTVVAVWCEHLPRERRAPGTMSRG